MFDLQSLSTNQQQPHWLSTVKNMTLEHTAKSVESLWSNRMKFSYPESNRCVDSIETLFTDIDSSPQNVYISRQKTEHIIRYNDLLPPLLRDGRMQELPSHYLSTSHTQHTIKIGRIQVHIQFTDRVCGGAEDTIQSPRSKSKDTQLQKQKRTRNRDHSNLQTPITRASGLDLQLPDLEKVRLQRRASADDNDSISSMSTPETTQHKKHFKNLVKFDNDVIGDSESDISAHVARNKNNKNKNKSTFDIKATSTVSLPVAHSLIYELTLDDLKFAFFLRLFPQLYFTHDLVYCQNSYQHHYYQRYFTSDSNEYECVVGDGQLMRIYHRYFDRYFISQSMDYSIKNKDKYRDYLSRKIVLFFQIRPRYHSQDCYEDEETNQTIDQQQLQQKHQHQQAAWNNLVTENTKNGACDVEMKDEESDSDEDMNGVVAASNGSHSVEHQLHSLFSYVNSSQESLVSDVIKAVNDTHNEIPAMEDMSVVEIDDDVMVEDEGVCAFCQRKFANERCREQKWIECEFCNKWYHVVCSGLSMDDYATHQTDRNAKKYKCLMCILSQ